jgi:hypothetical protein
VALWELGRTGRAARPVARTALRRAPPRPAGHPPARCRAQRRSSARSSGVIRSGDAGHAPSSPSSPHRQRTSATEVAGDESDRAGEAPGRRSGSPSRRLDCDAHQVAPEHRLAKASRVAGHRAEHSLSKQRIAHKDSASVARCLVRNFSTTSSGACGRRASAPSSPPSTGAHGWSATHRSPQHGPARHSQGACPSHPGAW